MKIRWIFTSFKLIQNQGWAIKHAFILIALFYAAAVAAEPTIITSNSFDHWFSTAVKQAAKEPQRLREEANVYLDYFKETDSQRVADSYYVIASTYKFELKTNLAREYFAKVLNLLDEEKNSKRYSDALRQIGQTYAWDGYYDKAYQTYNQVKLHATKVRLGRCLDDRIDREFAWLFHQFGNYLGAYEILKPLLNEKKDCNELDIAYGYFLAAMLQTNLGNFEYALTLYDTFFKFVPKDEMVRIADAKMRYALVLALLKMPEEAENKLKEVADMRIQKGAMHEEAAIDKYALMYIDIARERKTKALELGLELVKDIELKPDRRKHWANIQLLPTIIELLADQGEYQQANLMVERLLQSQKMAFEQRHAGMLAVAQVRQKLAEHEGKVAFLSHKSELDQIKLERSYFFIAFITLFVLFLLVIVLFLVRKYRQKNKVNRLLEEYAFETAQHAQLVESTLERKQTLFDEAHHRLKNNLHFILSLIEIQRSRLSSMSAAKIANGLLDASNRVQAMALIHDYYSEDDPSRVKPIQRMLGRFRDYSATIDGTPIEINVQSDEFELDTEVGKSLVLIVNELVTNAQKYAFDSSIENKRWKIDITLTHATCSKRLLTVQDNGKGLETVSELKGSDSVGMKLVRSLVDQIGGILSLEDRQEGTCWVVEF
ncbi:MAG: sensor histidine kinase [Acidiferrobacterales bacterium]|nr:sensor histidine kinase [Acidiferrobacterales bacterium]